METKTPKITLHQTTDRTGRVIEYARVMAMSGSSVLGQSIPLYRLTQAQRNLLKLSSSRRNEGLSAAELMRPAK